VRVRCERTGICSRKTTGHLAHFVARHACNSLDLLGPGKILADNGWQRKFEDPITLPGRTLVTLRNAADYIISLPKEESDMPEWQTAIKVLLL
jgi:hypothetical protein